MMTVGQKYLLSSLSMFNEENQMTHVTIVLDLARENNGRIVLV